MNDSTEPLATPELSMADTAKPVPSRIYTTIHLPRKIYEALPIAYLSAGALFVLGAVYIGIGHWSTIGYLAVGVACILAGLTVDGIRQKERSKSDASLV